MADYVPPKGYAAGLNFKGTYAPPPGYRVGLNFGSGEGPGGDQQYVSPEGLAPQGEVGAAFVAFAVRILAPASISAPPVPAPRVWNLLQRVLAPGIAAGAFGNAAQVWNWHMQAWPAGIAPGAAGRPVVYNLNQEVIASGLNAFRGFGEHWVSLGLRRITAGLGDQSRWGTAQMAGGVRELDLAGRGVSSAAYGRPTAWFLERQVFPAWFVATAYGRTLVDFNHSVEPIGIEAGAVGHALEVHRPRVLIDLQQLGIAGPLWGDHRIINFIQHVRPVGFAADEHDRFGRPEVALWVRYLQQLFEITPGDGGVFGSFNWVDNRNKMPRPEGVNQARYGVPSVRNNARVVQSLPFQDYSAFGVTLVAPRVRVLQQIGAQQTEWGSPLGMIVHNDARLLGPAGWDSGIVAQPERVWSNLQWTERTGGGDMAAVGTAFVAFAVRHVEPFPWPEPPRPGYASIDNWQRYVAAWGIPNLGMGVPTLEEHFSILAPAAIRVPGNQVGDGGRVWNLTPELRTHGNVTTLWGAGSVFNQFEMYPLQGFRSTVFGMAIVRDRRLTITPQSAYTLQFGPRLEVRNVLPDPPAPRTLGVSGWVDSYIGAHTVTFNTIYPPGEQHVRFGQARAIYMGVMPLSIAPPYDPDAGGQFGLPFLPGARYIVPKDERNGKPWTEWGRAALWPHYIWAPRGYPYTSGDEYDRGHIMDYHVHGPDRQERPVFGNTRVTNQYRWLTHRHDSLDNYGVFTTYGTPWVSLSPIHVRPVGARFGKYGVPRLNDANEVVTRGFVMSSLGEPSLRIVVPPGPQTVRPSGVPAPGFGLARVEFFHRRVAPSGFVALIPTGAKPGGGPSWPQLWTWVSHQYPPFPMTGFDAARVGTHWISFRVREIGTEGMDQAIVADYTLGQFKHRMRVQRKARVNAVTAQAGPSFGLPVIEQALRFVWPRPISPGRVDRPVVQGQWVIEPPGWDSVRIGNVDRWEAGKIKGHGDDLASMGRAVLRRALRPSGWAGVAGAPRVARPVAAHGFAQDGCGTPAAIARWCGNKAVAPQGAALDEFGSPTLSAG
ncbi:hypothetical protein [Stenotrophomonas maltophilia]|uniref:hypothetical protein n=1 Tax=Stenotrophomonas maltophilia TaxID=40324 RepID=UPI0021C63AB3|nr:hypothetical protein [Stenotrophomonas maltophilia]MCU1145800.1 hypothetical protein [Stenotrophomonas maltophilia]